MSQPPVDFLVVGGGAFGATASLELARRGHSVALLDPGPLPHPEASSTDISKIVRMDYGTDVFYSRLAELSMDRWRQWNTQLDRPLYHETGFLMMSLEAMKPGTFEHTSREALAEIGYSVQELGSGALARRFPAWTTSPYTDGYFNPTAGWVESGRAVRQVLSWCRGESVELRDGRRFADLLMKSGTVRGIVDDRGETHEAGGVIVAAGAWTPKLLPWLQPVMWTTGQPVFHLLPEDPENYRAEVFPIWSADISATGWYGFPAQPDGIVKVADHGAGIRIDPLGPKEVPLEYDEALRAFLLSSLPSLATAPIVARRICMYCDTADGDFWIDQDSERPGLTVATGGSGHGFKFAPVLGEIIADTAEGTDNPWQERFMAREPDPGRSEQARYPGEVF